MPADPPSSSVEARLRDAARLRRDAFDAAGPDATTMPGPTRARLHEELGRRFDAIPRGTASDWWARWWPALAGTLGTATAVVLFVIGSGQGPAGQSQAMKPEVAASAPSRPPPVKEIARSAPVATLPAPAAAPPPPRETSAPADQAGAAGGALAKAKDEPAPPAGIVANRPEPVRTQTFTQSPLPFAAAASRSAAFARQRMPPASAPNTTGARRGDAAAPVAAAPGSPPPALLGNFRFEQRGENVRLVDADGSVYVGQVEANKSPAFQGAPRVEDKARAQAPAADALSQSSPDAAGTENFRFRATGNNRTLRKPVVFEGEYSTQPLEASAAKKSESKSDAALTPNAEAQIRGRVQVLNGGGDPRPAEVDARSVEPR